MLYCLEGQFTNADMTAEWAVRGFSGSCDGVAFVWRWKSKIALGYVPDATESELEE